MALDLSGTESLTRAGSLKQAIARIEREYPQFLEPGYHPSAESNEAPAFEEYKALKNTLDREYQRVAFSQFLEVKKREDATADGALARMGLAPVIIPAEHPLEFQEGKRISLKEERGKICEEVIGEVKLLWSEIRRLRTNFTFTALRDKYPSLRVLEILSGPRFDEEDRDIICRPNRWEGKIVTYAVRLTERYYEVQTETIRSYRKAYKARFKIPPPPLPMAKRSKQRKRGNKS